MFEYILVYSELTYFETGIFRTLSNMYDVAFYSECFVTYSIFKLLLLFYLEPCVTLAYS